ncbi:uncharacterized [Tachysurus ichikawai]
MPSANTHNKDKRKPRAAAESRNWNRDGQERSRKRNRKVTSADLEPEKAPNVVSSEGSGMLGYHCCIPGGHDTAEVGERLFCHFLFGSHCVPERVLSSKFTASAFSLVLVGGRLSAPLCPSILSIFSEINRADSMNALFTYQGRAMCQQEPMIGPVSQTEQEGSEITGF